VGIHPASVGRHPAPSAKPLGITVYDHIIISKDGQASLKGLPLI
jgi:DNA repair protein RadC